MKTRVFTFLGLLLVSMSVFAVDPTISITFVQDAREPFSDGGFVFSSSEAVAGDLDISFTVGGTAIAGIDYQLSTTHGYIPAGNIDVFINVSVLDDAYIEPIETLIVYLESGIGYVVGFPDTATVDIISDDLEDLVFKSGFEMQVE